MDLFNTREIATAVWLAVFAGWALSQSSVRSAAASLLRAALRWKLVGIAAILAAYTTGIVLFLQVIGFWTSGLLKDTVLWFIFTGVATGFSAISLNNAESIAGRIVRDSVSVIILLEFLSNTYTFSLPVELVLIPVLFIIVALDAVADVQMSGTKVASFTKGLMGVAGLALIVGIVVQAIGNPSEISQGSPIRSILLAPVLSVAFIPCAVAVYLLSAYDMLFTRLRMGRTKSKDVVRYARRQLIQTLGIQPRRVRDFLATKATDLMRVQTRADVDRIIDGQAGDQR